MEVLEHVLRALVVQALGVVRGALLVDGPRPVALTFQYFQDQVFQIFKQHAQFFPDVVEEGLVSSAFPALLARFQLLGTTSHAQLNQSVFITPHAVARRVDDICHIFVRVGQRVAHHPPIITTCLRLDVFAEVPVELRAVLSLRSV